ncbi:hypothetical protein TMatcc_010612 [Talaromyces marneffei ATCC 18224]
MPLCRGCYESTCMTLKATMTKKERLTLASQHRETPMETPKGAPEAVGVPNSTGDGMGVVSGYPPQTQESQALEPPLLFPKPGSGWGGLVATDQQLAEAL